VIVRPRPESLLFITQPDHACLAADLVEHVAALAEHPRLDALRLAVREHDNGWRELDRDLVFDASAGQALDFIAVPDAVKHAVWPLAVERLASASPYAAALVAAHAIFVNAGSREKEDWRGFFADQEARRDALLARADAQLDELNQDYRWLAVADLMSLSFCHGWTDTRERFAHAVRCEGDTLIVTPAILPRSPVEVRVRARLVPDRQYRSAADLRAALDRATPEWIGGYACGRNAA
jgi:hypothetical protein